MPSLSCPKQVSVAPLSHHRFTAGCQTALRIETVAAAFESNLQSGEVEAILAIHRSISCLLVILDKCYIAMKRFATSPPRTNAAPASFSHGRRCGGDPLDNRPSHRYLGRRELRNGSRLHRLQPYAPTLRDRVSWIAAGCHSFAFKIKLTLTLRKVPIILPSSRQSRLAFPNAHAGPGWLLSTHATTGSCCKNSCLIGYTTPESTEGSDSPNQFVIAV